MSTIILDFLHEDPGLKLLFPDATYYSFVQNPQNVAAYPSIIPSQEIEQIEFSAATSNAAPPPAPLPTIMVIAPLYKCCYMWNGRSNPQFRANIYEYFRIFIHIISNYQFENILFFDTHAYQYDPNCIFQYYHMKNLAEKITFFKRNYANNIVYMENVFPFPYIGCGNGNAAAPCVIDLLQQFIKLRKDGNYKLPDRNRLFFSGKPMTKNDPVYGTATDCVEKLQKIKNTVGEYLVYREKMPDAAAYKTELSRSNFCLCLSEYCGAPTRRMFEILSAGSLLMCEISPEGRFMWNFGEEDFYAEMYFENETDLFAKLNLLGGKTRNYYMCLQKQNTIVDTYMNKKALRIYIKRCVDKIARKNGNIGGAGAAAAPPTPV